MKRSAKVLALIFLYLALTYSSCEKSSSLPSPSGSQAQLVITVINSPCSNRPDSGNYLLTFAVKEIQGVGATITNVTVTPNEDNWQPGPALLFGTTTIGANANFTHNYNLYYIWWYPEITLHDVTLVFTITYNDDKGNANLTTTCTVVLRKWV